MQGTASWKQTIITGVIAAIGYAVGVYTSNLTMSVLLIFTSILGGYALNAGVTSYRMKFAIKRSGTPYQNKMNQPK
jgi:hypothetical protein